MDWMDEVLDGQPKEAMLWKIGYIENLLHKTALCSDEQQNIFNSLGEINDIEADEIIKKIKEYEIKTDPKDQYEEMRKNGMFSDKCI